MLDLNDPSPPAVAAINAKRLLLNLVLAAGGESVAARDAVIAGSLFGLQPNNVRVTLARLVSDGLVESVRRGHYQLGPEGRALAQEVSSWRTTERKLCKWRGGWVAVHGAGLGRSDRGALARRDRALRLAGFRELERELYLRPLNLKGGTAALRQRLYGLGLEPGAAVFTLKDLDDARYEQAVACWNGEQLTRGYEKTRSSLATWLRDWKRLPLEVAAREAFLLGDAGIRQLVFDPLLPEPLVDAQVRSDFIQTLVTFDEVGRELWRRLYHAVSRRAETVGATV